MAVALVPGERETVKPTRPPLVGPGRLRKIGLLGSHEASLKFAPWDDPAWEFWGHASSRGMYRRSPDRLFDLHREACWTRSNNKGQKYLKFLQTNRIPIYMQEARPEIPASLRYPLEQVSMLCQRPYFTNHAAYMIALALSEGVTHIGFFGVNYSPDCEYGTQRGSTEYWIGRAEGMGVHMVFPPTCTLLADPKELYGYASHDAEGRLVHAYTKRVWTQTAPGTAPVLLPNGLEPIPDRFVKEAAEERLLSPPPDTCVVGPEMACV